MANQNLLSDERITIRNMEDVMHESMMPYAEHIILERALPRVEDGLKPVQRRILFTMLELGLTSDKPHRKSARIVGDCLGKYHPHGDSSVYEAMVHLSQPFNMRVPLVDGHGNFGSMDGDSAAAMRYTEARMTSAAMYQLIDIDKDTVSFSFNFDDTLKEPDLLPGRFPNLLVNGSMGIAIGLATNIPPHNPGEAIDAVIAYMENPKITLDEIMKIIPCPDFPMGAYLLNSDEIRNAYETGRGKLTVRAKTHIEDSKNGKTLIVVDEFPYQVNKAACLEKILAVTQEKKALFAGINDIRDESDRMGVRAVIEVRKDYDAEKILQYLFKYSDLQTTFGVNMVAIADGKPQQLSLLQIISYYVAHQKDVVTRRTKNELETAEKREHILAGLMIAVNNLDEVIAIIRASKSPKEAKESLISRFKLTEIQAQAILDLRLQRLTNLELRLIEEEYAQILDLIAELKGILASEKKLIALIKKEMLLIKKEIDSPRKTQLINEEITTVSSSEEEQELAEDVSVIIYDGLKARRMPRRFYNPETITDEKALFVVHTDTTKRIRIFTSGGALMTIGANEIPETRYAAKSVNLAALFPFEEGEQIINVFDESNEGEYIFYTAKGLIKRSPTSDYQIRSKRTVAMKIPENDSIIGISMFSELKTILMVSRTGMSIRFNTEEIPSTGRNSGGVKSMKIKDDDSVVFASQVGDEGELLLITDKGYGKRSFIFDYEIQGRNGKGVKTYEFKKNGSNGTGIVSGFYVKEPFDFVVTQRHGTQTTISTDQVHIEEKTSKGRLIVAVVLDDDVISVERVKSFDVSSVDSDLKK